MKLVLDANILFSFFKKRSFTRTFILNHPEIGYFTPRYVFDELDNYKDVIINKSGIEEKIYRLIIKELKSYVEIVEVESLRDFWDTAEKNCPDPNDVHYFASALYLNCTLWTNDKKLKNQDIIKTINTEELAKLFGE